MPLSTIVDTRRCQQAGQRRSRAKSVPDEPVTSGAWRGVAGSRPLSALVNRLLFSDINCVPLAVWESAPPTTGPDEDDQAETAVYERPRPQSQTDRWQDERPNTYKARVASSSTTIPAAPSTSG
jgi:hypothetical protein